MNSNDTTATARQLADEKVREAEQAMRMAVATRNNLRISQAQRNLVAAIAERDAL